MVIHSLPVMPRQYACLASQEHFHLKESFLSMSRTPTSMLSVSYLLLSGHWCSSGFVTQVLDSLHGSFLAEIATPPAQPCKNRGVVVSDAKPAKGQGESTSVFKILTDASGLPPTPTSSEAEFLQNVSSGSSFIKRVESECVLWKYEQWQDMR